MKKILITLFIVLLSSSVFAKNSHENHGKAGNQVFTLQELAKYNGKNGAKAYVAIDGTVYDVSNVEAWKNGEHKRGLKAGQDLSAVIDDAPHARKVLAKLPIVGTLKK
jgi:predicted heme/steroid binding protein